MGRDHGGRALFVFPRLIYPKTFKEAPSFLEGAWRLEV
jgi:hypothetical protein